MEHVAIMRLMNNEDRVLFLAEYERRKKRKGTAVALTLLFGGVGAHRFYLEEYGWGALYALTCFTFVPALVALVEVFFISERVEVFNKRVALECAAMVRAGNEPPKAPTSIRVSTVSDIPITIDDGDQVA